MVGGGRRHVTQSVAAPLPDDTPRRCTCIVQRRSGRRILIGHAARVLVWHTLGPRDSSHPAQVRADAFQLGLLRVEVMGFEPTASTLRMWSSRPLTRLFSRAFLVAAFRSPQVPSRSLSFSLNKDTQRHARTESVGDYGPIPRSIRQALARRSGWRPFPVGDDHVPRRASGHVRPCSSNAYCRTDDGAPMLCPPPASRQRPVGSRPPGDRPGPGAYNCALPGNGPIQTPSKACMSLGTQPSAVTASKRR